MPADPQSQSPAKLLGGRFAMLLGLTGLAIAQPLLSVLSSSPETFTFYNFNSTDIVVFALLLAFMPPTLLWAIETIIYLFNKNAAKWTHQTFCAALLTIFVQQLLVTIGLTLTALAWTLSISAGIALFIALTRVDALSSFLKLMGFLPFVAVALFLFSSPVADLMSAIDGQEAVAAQQPDGDEPLPSVIVVVLDEFPTQSLVTADERVDAVRFPNLAGFADDATWYRHNNTTSPFTSTAVPSLLTGLEPAKGTRWITYPDNLFSLLGESHHLTVSESITSLCNLPGCTSAPTPPPSPDGPDPVPVAEDGADFNAMFKTTRRLLNARLSPSRSTEETFDDFEEDLAGPARDENPEPEQVEPDDASADESPSDTPPPLLTMGRQAEFVDALIASDEPTLYFLHLVHPHQPWRFNEDGTTYSEPTESGDGGWHSRVLRQRHLLQATNADLLLGQILDKAKSEGIYEDSLVVVVADHGVAFKPGEGTRRYGDGTVPAITYSPLFIKPPGQTQGSIDDVNGSSVDLLSTIAAELDITIPWDVDGADLTSDLSARGDEKRTYDWVSRPYKLHGIIEFDDAVAYPQMLSEIFPPIKPDDDARSGLWATIDGGPELIGSSVDALDTTSIKIPLEIVGYESFTEPTEPGTSPPGVLSGWVDEDGVSDNDERVVVVAIDGKIVALSLIEPRDDKPGWFETLLPPGSNPPLDLEVFLIDPDTGVGSPTTLR